MIAVELVAMSVLFLISCLMLRSAVLAEEQVPPALLHFVDLTLALAAGAIALTGMAQSTVTLGPVPSWVVAIGPSLVVAAMVLGIHLWKRRGDTPRWSFCLVAGVLAAAAVGPCAVLLASLFAPVTGLLPLPGM